MSKNTKLLSFLCIFVWVSSCVGREPRASSALDLEKTLAEAVELFNEHSLPNTMTRPPGFDIDGYLRDIDERRMQITKVFYTPEGAAYLIRHLEGESDEMTVLAILRVLFESGEPAALPVFQKYAHHSSSVVSE